MSRRVPSAQSLSTRPLEPDADDLLRRPRLAARAVIRRHREALDPWAAAAPRLASRHSTDTDFVFASQAGTPLGHHNVARRGLEPALEAAKLPRLTWHDLRHVAASALIAEGASVAYVSRVLGHANPAITLSVYAHEFARVEHADRTRDAMEAAFGELLR